MSPLEINRLSNECFISSNYGSVTLFDKSFRQLKKADISASGCAIHNQTDIYVTDYASGCIYLLDNELNLQKTFGSKGDRMDQLYYPTTICCQNKYLFVSDKVNERIQILTLDLQYHDTVQLNFHPESIAVSSATIGIQEYCKHIFFYDIKTKKMKKEYPSISGRISLIDSHFYVLTYNPPKKLFIFDQEGELIDEASVESISEHIRNETGRDGSMFLMNDYLFISSFSGRKLLKYKL